MLLHTKVLLFINSIICSIYDFFTYLTFAFFKPKILKKNIDLKKCRHSDTCFVIGNGPSLNTVDFELLSGYDVLTVNGFYLGNFDFKSLYHVMIDPVHITGICDDDIEMLLKKNPNAKVIINYKFIDYYLKKGFNINNLFGILPKIKNLNNFVSYDLTKPISDSNNVIPVAIECAMYIGYKNIILLGCDFSMYTKNPGVHFFDCDKANPINPNYLDNFLQLFNCSFVHKNHYSIAKTAKYKGINILNATTDSLINAYDFVDLKDLIKDLKKV